MGVSESEFISQGEANSPMQSDQQTRSNNHLFSSLGRQSSIYSLTLDEFQHTLCESGKNFGSMNMDEFLASIWTAEENQAINPNNTSTTATATNDNDGAHQPSAEAAVERAASIAKQPSLARQGSLTLPAPLCRKTVDEVWSEIHKGQQGKQQNNHSTNGGVLNSEFAPRQPTFGEMTLEDFLVKAGVVRETEAAGAVPPLPPQQQYGLYQNSNPAVGSSFVNMPGMGMGTGGAAGVSTSKAAGMPNYQTMPQSGAAVGGETSEYVANGKRNGAYPVQPPPHEACFGRRGANGGGGYGAGESIGMAAPVSPVSSDGMCPSQVENNGGQFGLDMGGLRGRKRIIDGPVEKVVERRQRRMIKNRESAARSRARKQAYTVELEAELNQLREENSNLKQALAELERKRKQQYFEEMKMRVQTKAQKAREKLRMLRRSNSCLT